MVLPQYLIRHLEPFFLWGRGVGGAGEVSNITTTELGLIKWLTPLSVLKLNNFDGGGEALNTHV